MIQSKWGEPMPDQFKRGARLKAVIQVSSGNFLEMYDFTVFAYYAAAIGTTFFPGGSPSASLLKSLATFAVGFLMRPLGALVLGAYIDRHGRRAGLILSLALMSVGTASIAILPGYAALGLISPLLILAGRLLQGFSAGVELGGVSVYLSEIATPGNKGFYVSWQSGSQQVAVIFASLLGAGLAVTLSPADMADWGWRIPLLVGCAIIPFLFVLRASLPETEEFLAQPHHPSAGEILRSVAANWQLVLLGMMLVSMTTASFYLITAYTPTFGHNVLHLPMLDSLVVTVCVGLSNLLWLPLGGALSDRIGRKPVLIATTLLAIVTAYPVMLWLVAAPSFGNLLLVELWLSFIYGCYNGAMVVFLTEIMPVSVRTSGFSVAYALATAIFGGSTPLIVTWLIDETHNQAVAGIWVSIVAVLGLAATLLLKEHVASVPTGAAKVAA
jgi:MFS family permease